MNNIKYKTILNDISININEHRFISISGTNKCGKTTLIKILSGIIDTEYKVNKKNVGVILNNKNNFIHKTVDKVLDHFNENVEEVICKKIISYLSMNKLLKRKIEKLTGFEELKLKIAIELIKKNNILLIDDIDTYLTKKEQKELFILLNNLVEEDIRIIYTTNKLEDTLYSDYLYILDCGKIVLEGKPLLVLKEDTTLNKLGLELPFMVDFSIKLMDYNIIEEIELDIDRMVDTIWK